MNRGSVVLNDSMFKLFKELIKYEKVDIFAIVNFKYLTTINSCNKQRQSDRHMARCVIDYGSDVTLRMKVDKLLSNYFFLIIERAI